MIFVTHTLHTQHSHENKKCEKCLLTSETLSTTHFVCTDKSLNDFWIVISSGQNPILQHKTGSMDPIAFDDDRYEMQN